MRYGAIVLEPPPSSANPGPRLLLARSFCNARKFFINLIKILQFPQTLPQKRHTTLISGTHRHAVCNFPNTFHKRIHLLPAWLGRALSHCLVEVLFDLADAVV